MDWWQTISNPKSKIQNPKELTMAQRVAVPAEERPLGRKSDLKEVRRSGKIPAVLYGKGTEPRSVQIPAKEMEHIIRRHGHSAILELNLAGGESLTALIKETQHHRISGHLQHLGLQSIRMSDTIHTSIAISLVGTATAVEDAGGVLGQTLTELPVVGRADQLPESITVDISAMTMGAMLRVADLHLPEGVTTSADPEQVVATTSISAAARQEATEAAEAAAAAAEAAEAAEAAPAEAESKE
jgi:large subunit ribosomal protein L25